MYVMAGIKKGKKATVEYVLIGGTWITSKNVLLVTQSYKILGEKKYSPSSTRTRKCYIPSGSLKILNTY